ncbi:MAG: DNA translocase FtsK, partial [Eubacteriales bacterium]
MAENQKRKRTLSDDDFSEYDDAYTVKEEDMAGFSRRNGKKRGEKSEGEKSEGQKSGTDHAQKNGTHGAESSRGASSQGEKGHAGAEGKRGKPVNPSSVGNQIMIAVLAALAVFIVICFAAAEKVGVIGGFISEFLPGLFGGAALLIPIMLLIHALYWKRDAAGGTRLFRVMFSFAVTLFFSVVLHVIFAAAGSVPVEGKMGVLLKDFYVQGITYTGGGSIGGLIGTLGIRGLGVPGALIFSILFLVISIILFIGYTPGIIWRRAVFYLMRYIDKRKAEKSAKKEREAGEREKAAAASAAGTAIVVRRGVIGEDILSGNGITDDDNNHFADTYDPYGSEQSTSESEVKDETVSEPAPIIEDVMPVKRTKIKREPKKKSEAPSVILAGENGEPAIIPEEPPVPEYQFPPIELLAFKESSGGDTQNEMTANAQKIVSTLGDFNIRTRVIGISRGPAVTRYEIAPESGTKVAAIMNRTDDISLSLASAVRISGVIPGKSAIGIEVPNKNVSTVYLRSLIDSDEFRNAKSKVTAALGIDITGAKVFFDIAKMPHLLIAGATGMGKSVCMNSLIISILYKARPDEVKFIFIDPKKVEFNMYNG